MDLYHFTRTELADLLASWGWSSVHASRLWSYLYREGSICFELMSELPPRLRERLQQETKIRPLETLRETSSSDGLTRKFLLGLADHQAIETVLMRFRDRVTACISTQVGCPLGCVFCATGQLGFTRNLTAAEIVAQAMAIDRVLRAETQERLRNIVLMGMGEPLLNYAAVMQALDVLRDPGGLAIAVKRITISTVGVVPGIVRLADEDRPYSLAVSLHAATQEERLPLIPVARTWPLEELMHACRYYVTKTQRKIFFEWTLIAGLSDRPEQARSLAQLLGELPCQVNLIPLNPTDSFTGTPGATAAVAQFQAILLAERIPTTIRQRRGIDIAAGCGQLAGSE